MNRTEISLNAEESFYLYHLICTYTTGDYLSPNDSTKEAARDVANRIRTGCKTLEFNREEYLAVCKSFTAEGDVPVSIPNTRALFERICENAPKSANEYINYGPEWEKTRREVLKRDDYRCRRCGETQREHHERVGHGLHIHHIKPIREFDERSEANRVENLTALCAECHGIEESQEEPSEDVINEAFDGVEVV